LPSSGLFITLYDKETLRLYLDRGVYGQLMAPVFGEISTRSRHYQILADYACTREGAHIFFFLQRRIVYGGQIIGSKRFGSFYLNGPYSPMGRKAKAKLFWDESERTCYQATDKPGIFQVRNVGERCQPYLIQFEDKLNLKGLAISSDQLYFELGKYSYPLPSNSISGMGFCTLTPGETETALLLLRKEAKDFFQEKSHEDIYLKEAPLSYNPNYGISKLTEVVSEAHLEASILANPLLLPEWLRPRETTLCRQVPISPFKPFQMDRADICYFSECAIADGTIPNTIIELKNERAGKAAIDQIKRYLDWLYKIQHNEASKISLYLLAPSFTRPVLKEIPPKYRSQVTLVDFKNTKSAQKHLS